MKKLLYILLFIPLALFGQDDDPCYSITDFMVQTESSNPSITKNFQEGWNMFGYPCTQSINITEAFVTIVDKITIVKDNSGNVYIPEFSFNGIGDLSGGEGYQLKITDDELGFSFCNTITWPGIEGCIDCEATNYNRLANLDNGSCIYDTDGDGINDIDEILGCQDINACNFDEIATDEGDCTYPEEGYNCDGIFTPKIGDFVEGGVVFYIDESGDKGLVISTQTIGDWATWGCEDVSLPNAVGESIGTGLTNTLFGCSDENSAAALCLSYEMNGYDDWYLPSVDELDSAFTNIFFPYYFNELDVEFNYSAFSWIWSSTAYIYTHAKAIKISGSASQWIGDDVRYRLDGHLVVPIRAFGYTIGCMDETSCNYNSDADMSDGSCEYSQQDYDCDGNYLLTACPYPNFFEYNEFALNTNVSSCLTQIVEGCEDSIAENFNPEANLDDGSCEYIYGCTLDIFPNYNSQATVDDGSCDMNSNDVYGCLDTLYFEFESLANIDNGTCINLLGCIDETACNFNPEANQPDGSCEYAEQGYDCDGYVVAEIGDIIEGGYLFYIDETGEHGLVAAMEDMEGAYEWGCFELEVDGAEGQWLGSGYENTLDNVNYGCVTENGGNTAAQTILNNEFDGYNDWYIPSFGEFIEMYQNLIDDGSGNTVNIQNNLVLFNFINTHYWMSTEAGPEESFCIDIPTVITSCNKNQFKFVRPIRSF